MIATGNQAVIAPGMIRPYISLIFLEYTGEHEARDFDKLLAFMKGVRKDRQGRTCTLLRSGFTGIDGFLRNDVTAHGADQISGFIYKVEAPPAWAASDAHYTDVRHFLSIVLRRGRMLAVSCEQSLRDAITKWLKREPAPPFRLISQNLIQGAFLRGDAKGLWLHGTHLRSRFRPDTKHIAGIRVDDALSPLDDSSFAMSAARAELPQDLTLTALLGVIGTSPRKGTMWNRQAEDLAEFLNASVEALELIDQTLANDAVLDRPFPILAVESHDLSGVRGAYDILTLTPDDLPTSTEVSADMVEAAAVLQRATFNVTGSSKSADFQLDVGFDGSIGGRLQATLHMKDDRVVFRFGYAGEPTNPGPVRQILNALEHNDLFAVYYDSGHVIGPHGIGHRNVNPVPFDNWRFQDFSGYDITSEKPGNTPSVIHADTGTPQDVSLFGWVVQHYSSGWLICDDGPGEVADFVHIDDDGMLTMVHVKAAHSASRMRGVAVSAFEVVAGQAVKNSRYLIEPDLLAETLMIPHSPERGAWSGGRRVPDRTEFLTMVACLAPDDKKRVVIVQPHVSESMYCRIRGSTVSNQSAPPQELFRLRTLETLLHSARAAAVALGADLHVIGSKV